MARRYQQTLSIQLQHETVGVQVQAAQRKSMRLSVTETGDIDLRIPLRASRQEVLAFLQQHQPWLEQRRQQQVKQLERWQQEIPVLGRLMPVVVSSADEFLVGHDRIWVPASWQGGDVAKAMDSWYRQQAKWEYQRLIEQWWPNFSHCGEKPVLRVKKMRTRWGSLSKRGYINLNLALMQCPLELIELVVVHELCHLAHFDHGIGFQRVMDAQLPDWRQREKALQQQQSLLL